MSAISGVNNANTAIQDNKKIVNCYSPKGELTGQRQTIFDGSGHVIEEDYLNAVNGDFLPTARLYYDENGNQIKEESFDTNGKLVERRTSPGGAVTDTFGGMLFGSSHDGTQEHFDYDANGNLAGKTIKTYSNGHLSTSVNYDSKGNVIGKYQYSYDAKGNITALDQFNANGTLVRKEEDTYDANGKAIGSSTYNYDYSTGNFLGKTVDVIENGHTKTRKDYDTAGNIIKESNYDAKGKPVKAKQDNNVNVFKQDSLNDSGEIKAVKKSNNIKNSSSTAQTNYYEMLLELLKYLMGFSPAIK